jgi:spore germination protein YaaH
VSGWMPYWTPDTSLASFKANAKVFSDVTGFWHSATGATTIINQLSDSRRSEIVDAVHAKGVKLIAAVTDGTAAHKMASILDDPAKRSAHVKALVQLAVSNHYDGIDLDYEKFAFYDGSASWAKTRPDWVAFVRELSAALHAKGLWLTVAVPVMYDADRDGSSGYWVYDYAGIADAVDRLRIMTYDYSVSVPGPIAPIAWVRRVLDFAVTQVPAAKIQVGVPAYGRDWPTSTAGCPVNNMPAKTGLTSRAAEALAHARGIKPTWNATYAEKTFSYKKTYSGVNKNGKATSCKIKRTVWFEEAKATKRRAALVDAYKLGGIAQWTIGGEDKAQWAKLRDYARSISRVSPRVQLKAGDIVHGASVNVHATVRTAGGSPITGEDWVLYWRGHGTQTWTKVGSGRTTSNGTMSSIQKPTRTGSWKLWVGGSWSRYSAETAPNQTLVRTKVSAAFAKRSVAKHKTVRLHGSVAPRVGGLKVERQRKLAGQWVTVGTTKTESDGTFSMKVVPVEKGYYTYRVKVSGAAHRANGFTGSFALLVN